MANNKRANGEGTIRKKVIKGKTYWETRVVTGYDSSGKPIRKSFYGKTQAEALQKMKDFNKYKEAAPNADNMTFGQWYYTYLFEFRKQDLKPSSFERYYSIYLKYIKSNPRIYNCELTKLKATTLQTYYNALIKDGVKSSTIKTLNRYFKPCLNEAVKQDYIIKNPCVYVSLPKDHTPVEEESDKKVVFLTLEEQQKFTNYIKGHKNEALFLLALGTGLREGELLALKWGDIDMDNLKLKVTRSIKRVPVIDEITNNKRKYEIVEQTPKTKNSIRTVPIPSKIIPVLKRHKASQNKIRLENADVWLNNNYVFCNDVGAPIDSKKPLRQFQSILKKLEIKPMKFHALRHTYATRLIEAGAKPSNVQELMGHSDIATTYIYVHATEEGKVEEVKKLDCLFE
ncbi:site-specific integrase [Clostridium sp.]|uniref:tyrosine-type recombinase/integrase n=1 Tax=Clostridium sp. TaxID=1506 RepID=UPI003217B27E